MRQSLLPLRSHQNLQKFFYACHSHRWWSQTTRFLKLSMMIVLRFSSTWYMCSVKNFSVLRCFLLLLSRVHKDIFYYLFPTDGIIRGYFFWIPFFTLSVWRFSILSSPSFCISIRLTSCIFHYIYWWYDVRMRHQWPWLPAEFRKLRFFFHSVLVLDLLAVWALFASWQTKE